MGGFLFGWLLCMFGGSGIIEGEIIHVWDDEYFDFFFGCHDGAHGVLWSMMVDVLGGIVPLFIYVDMDWPYAMYTRSVRLLR